jgi:peptidoglycan/xylan/chitin deacetylase (PgdA/CDA1 family)
LTILHKLFLALLASSFTFVDAGVYQKCVTPGMWAMTFSDGPTLNIPTLLNTLSAKNVKVSFNFVTKYLTDPNVQAIVQSVAAAGHLVGLRTETDWNLMSMSTSDITSNLQRLATVMSQFTGYKPTFVSLPAGGYDARVVSAVEAAGFLIVAPNMDSMDYNGDASKIYNSFSLAITLVADGQGNFISVQRDGVPDSVAKTGDIIDLIKTHGYQFVKLDSCVGNVAPPTPTTYVTTTTSGTQTMTQTSTITNGGNNNNNNGTSSEKSAAESNFATQFAIAQLVLGVIGMLLLTL